MSIKNLKIKGLRGFSEEVNVQFAIPDKQNPGSGLTILVGANNSGKSTIIEAIHLLTRNADIIPISSRNEKTQGNIEIEVEDTIGNILSLHSTVNKGAFVQKEYNNEIVEHWVDNMNTFILSSKRGFSSTFHNNSYMSRENYKGNISESDYRSENNVNNNFGGRLLKILKNREKFDECLGKVLSPLPEWTIEASDNNSLFLEFSFEKAKHSSKGAGDGYINIFNIVDALYDSSENNVILIDEPEISLHPDLQRKLFSLLVEYSKDKQIIVSTHSPYFVDWKLFSKTAKIIRLKKVKNSIRIFELTDKTCEGIKKIINDGFQPHTLSLDANEIFFLNDDIILTEGQDDVLCYKEIFKKYNFNSKASFFGWGAGGAPKIEFILNILIDLGYEKVFTILDNDQRDKLLQLKTAYPGYEFYTIIADDVRDKKRSKNIDMIINSIEGLEIEYRKKDEIIKSICSEFKNKKGLVKDMSTYEINKEFDDDIINLLKIIQQYFSTPNTQNFSISNIQKRKKEEKIKNNKIDDTIIARQLLDNWIKEKHVFEYASKKYKNFEFDGGGGGELSFKKINEHTYYVIIEQKDSISKNHYITVNYYLLINTKESTVKLKRRQVVANTLPISRFAKILQKVCNW